MHYRITLPTAAALLRADDAASTAVVEAAARYLGAAPGDGPADVRLAARAGRPPEPPASDPLCRFEDRWGLWREGPGRFLLGDGDAAVRLDVCAGEGALTATPDALDARPSLSWALLLGGLLFLLRGRGLFSLHAAGLAPPASGGAARGGGPAGLLLVAERDAGKSTLAYALVREGWDYLTDDTVLLRPGPGGVEAFGLRSYFSLDAEADALFPGLDRARRPPLFGEAKRPVDVDALHPGRRVERLAPRLLVFPKIADASESQLLPLARAEALRRVVGQSASVLAEPDGAPAHLDALARLVRQTRHVRLLAGRDVLHQPARVAALLASLLAPP